MTVDARVVAAARIATCARCARAARSARICFYRLSVVSILVMAAPPLRDAGDDLQACWSRK